mgnify:CR=1 FL=1
MDGLKAVDGLPKGVEQAAECRFAHWDRDGLAGIDGLHSARQAVGRTESQAADPVVADMLFDLENESLPV